MGREYTELAIIEPLDMDFSKEKVLSKVSVVTGEHAHRKFSMMVPVNMFRYHFWGSTFEVIKYNEKFELLDARDIVKDDLPRYNLGVVQALAYNQMTHEVVATNGFVYNIDDSLYGKYCPHICQRIYGEIATAGNFTLMLITLNGAVIDLTFDKNVNPADYPHRNILTSGFVTTNTKALRFTMPTSKAAVTDRNEKLSQDDIDDLIEKMLGDRR